MMPALGKSALFSGFFRSNFSNQTLALDAAEVRFEPTLPDAARRMDVCFAALWWQESRLSSRRHENRRSSLVLNAKQWRSFRLIGPETRGSIWFSRPIREVHCCIVTIWTDF